MLFWQEVDQKRNQIKLHVKKFTGRRKCFFEIIAFQLNTALIPKPTHPVRGNRMRESCRITWAWANYQHHFHLIHKQIKGDEDFHSEEQLRGWKPPGLQWKPSHISIIYPADRRSGKLASVQPSEGFWVLEQTTKHHVKTNKQNQTTFISALKILTTKWRIKLDYTESDQTGKSRNETSDPKRCKNKNSGTMFFFFKEEIRKKLKEQRKRSKFKKSK